ncbi:type II toxin-antitoxin system RelE/ParE family toxin [Algoriphagus sp. E1-3-M2]|nr:type II toxin-antitoxin system RelE/ParE family toxin [Algoriphagus sp. E1-3-M2]
MSFEVKTISVFEKQFKRLAKKYPSLKPKLFKLIQLLKISPKQGNPLGKNCYKIRLPIKSKGKGKSGGGRIITNVAYTTETVYLLSIYDKSEKLSLSNTELIELLRDTP